jgi:sugar phosphate isomerase/epimerase
MLAITSDSFVGYGLDRAFALAAEAGLDGIEVVIRHGEFDTYSAEYLQELSKRHKLPIVAISTPMSLNAAKALRAVDLAAEVGAPIVNLTPPDIFDFNYRKWLREEMPAIRKKKKITVAVVNPPVKNIFGFLPQYAFGDIYQLRDNLEEIAFDVSNTLGRSEPLLEIYSILKRNIRYIYLSNAKASKNHTLFLDGNLPLESLLTRLAKDNSTTTLTLKFNPKSLGVGKVDKMLGNLANCRKFVAKYLKG